jgi:hypothetical protein
MRRAITAAVVLLVALGSAAVAQAKPIVPKTPVPTTPSITGAVYTTVNLNDPNYASECKNGNPAVNCNQYTAKQFVFLNGGPSNNQLQPDGVYFFAVLGPSGQSNPADGTSDNLSDDYDCYLNREIVIKNGEVSGVLKSTDPACFKNPAVLPVGTGHLLSSPFVQLWPYTDSPNNGGVYIMAVCYVGSPATTPTAPIALTNSSNVDPKLCKYDAFKVLVDTVRPTCKLISTSSGPPKSITVAIQDAGAGLESVFYSGTNIVSPPQFPTPLVVGQTSPFYVIATKDVQTKGSTLSLTVTDTAGNSTTCDPAFGAARHVRSASVRAGHRLVLSIRPDQSSLRLHAVAPGVRSAMVLVNGHRFALIALRNGNARLSLASSLRLHEANVLTIVPVGPTGALTVRISNS